MGIPAFFRLCSFILFLAISPAALAQKGNVAALQERVQALQQNKEYKTDTAWLNAVNMLAFTYAEKNPDTALLLLQHHADDCRKAKYGLGEAAAYINTGVAYYNKGDYTA